MELEIRNRGTKTKETLGTAARTTIQNIWKLGATGSEFERNAQRLLIGHPPIFTPENRYTEPKCGDLPANRLGAPFDVTLRVWPRRCRKLHRCGSRPPNSAALADYERQCAPRPLMSDDHHYPPLIPQTVFTTLLPGIRPVCGNSGLSCRYTCIFLQSKPSAPARVVWPELCNSGH